MPLGLCYSWYVTLSIGKIKIWFASTLDLFKNYMEKDSAWLMSVLIYQVRAQAMSRIMLIFLIKLNHIFFFVSRFMTCPVRWPVFYFMEQQTSPKITEDRTGQDLWNEYVMRFHWKVMVPPLSKTQNLSNEYLCHALSNQSNGTICSLIWIC